MCKSPKAGRNQACLRDAWEHVAGVWWGHVWGEWQERRSRKRQGQISHHEQQGAMEGFMQGSQNVILERSLLLSSVKTVAGIQVGVEVALGGAAGSGDGKGSQAELGREVGERVDRICVGLDGGSA